MSRTFTAVLIVSSGVQVGICGDGPARSLPVDTIRTWSIIVSGDVAPCQKYAAEEFQYFYREATQATLAVKASATKQSGHIFIGPGAALKTSPLGHLMDRAYDEEELRIVVTEDNIAITGGSRGTLYGVYTFLEDYLGVRFLTADVAHVPKTAVTQTIPLIDRTYKPPFAYRFYLKTEVMKDPIFAVRRRQNAASQYGPKEQRIPERLGSEATGGVFLHNNFMLSTSFTEHPEYFSLRDGKRAPLQPCLTHPEVRRTVTRRILGSLDGYAPGSTIPLAQNDNGSPCLCQRCAAAQREGDAPGSFRMPDKPLGVSVENTRHGPPSAVVIDFVNHVAEAVADERLDLWVGTEAYAYTMMPPRKTRTRSNVKVQVATYHCSVVYSLDDPRSSINRQFNEYLAGWRNVCDHLLIWSYDMNPREYLLPFPNMRSQPVNLRAFVRNNGRGVFMQGTAENTEFSDLRAYVTTSLLWNPSQDADRLTDEFLSLFYGRSARPVREWIDLFHDQAEASGSESNINATAKHYGLDAALGKRGLELFEEAIQLAESETIRDRVEKISVTALRLALEPIWWNAIEAPRRARILKTTVEQERIAVDASVLPRFREMATKLFVLAEKHGMHAYKEGGQRAAARNLVFSYLKLPQETQEGTKK